MFATSFHSTTLGETILHVLRYSQPGAAFTYYILANVYASISFATFQASENPITKRIHRSLLASSLFLYALVAFVQGCFILYVFPESDAWYVHDEEVVTALGLGFFASVLAYHSKSVEYPVWYCHWGCWTILLLFEIPLAYLSVTYTPSVYPTAWPLALVTFSAIRSVCLLSTFAIYGYACLPVKEVAVDEECEPLLASSSSTNGAEAETTVTSYGGTDETNNQQQEATAGEQGNSSDGKADAQKTKMSDKNKAAYDAIENDPNLSASDKERRKNALDFEIRIRESGNWITYLKRYRVIMPYIWPLHIFSYQVRFALNVLCLLLTSVLGVLTPLQTGKIYDMLAGYKEGSIYFQLFIFCVLRLLSSSAGLPLLCNWLNFPISQYGKEHLNTRVQEHVLSLSASFHDEKSSSEIMTAIRQSSACANIVEIMFLRTFPQLLDVIVTLSLLCALLGPYECLIAIVISSFFMSLSSNLINQVRKPRSAYVENLREENRHLLASIDGWQTVFQFNRADMEHDRYRAAVRNTIASYRDFLFMFFGTYAFQSITFLVGFFLSAMLAMYRIEHGYATPGSFAVLITFWNQLTSPLQALSRVGRDLFENLIDAEKAVDVLLTESVVKDSESAKELVLTKGDVEFRNVTFAYAGSKATIKSFSFLVKGGTTVAFVGATGSGKTTLLKLVTRMYDVSDGAILLDGQDIRDVTQNSLRNAIGSVPQAPVLFNDTIMNNIRYARLDATDEEVHEAARAACMHDKIMSFANQYETVVGERGIKLSGGELQRVAIARAFLKGSPILLLDEATSAVDTETEHVIQESITRLREGRTTIVIAHRLSTIMKADKIVVVHDGECIEEGNHAELIEKGGRYTSLWEKQVFYEPKEEEEEENDENVTDKNVIGEDDKAVAEGSLSRDDTDVETPAQDEQKQLVWGGENNETSGGDSTGEETTNTKASSNESSNNHDNDNDKNKNTKPANGDHSAST